MPQSTSKLSILLRVATVAALISVSPPTFAAEPHSGGTATPEQAICSDTMRLQPGLVQYSACIESLSKVAGMRAEQQKIALASQECSHSTTEGSDSFSTCVLARSRGETAASEGRDSSANATSYMSSNAERRRALQEQACAKFGFVPGQAGFIDCVIRLQVSIESVSNPS